MFLLPVEWGRTRRFWGGKGFKSPYTSISLPLCNRSLICTSNLAGAHLRRESGQRECPRWSGVHHCCWTHPCSLPDPFSIPLPTSFFPSLLQKCVPALYLFIVLSPLILQTVPTDVWSLLVLHSSLASYFICFFRLFTQLFACTSLQKTKASIARIWEGRETFLCPGISTLCIGKS